MKHEKDTIRLKFQVCQGVCEQTMQEQSTENRGMEQTTDNTWQTTT